MKPVKCVCGGDSKVMLWKYGGGYYVDCRDGCDWIVPVANTKAGAVRIWNAMQKAAKKEAKR